MRRSPAEKARLVAAFKQSGQSQQAFCEAKGLNKSTLSYWLKKENPNTRGFIPVEVPQEPLPSIELTYPNGIKLSVSQGSPEFISQLIKSYIPC